jgi:uncharacterized protein (DUF2252 family)
MRGHQKEQKSDKDRTVVPVSAAARRDEGWALRERCPRSGQAQLGLRGTNRDPVAVIKESSEGRVENLIPLRYSRMLESPFTFFRGSAILQAMDLARTHASGIKVQACGDAHLMNFGGFATPERDLIFDLNDFDETFPAPWEWDVKRLCASVVVAARWRGFSESVAHESAVATAARYREMMNTYADMPMMAVWYSSLSYDSIRTQSKRNPKLERLVAEDIKRAQNSTADHVYTKIVTHQDGAVRIVDEPPLLFHVDAELKEHGQAFLHRYRATLREDYRVLFDRFRLADAALKVIGVGSVGMRCYIVLLFDEHDAPLFLQIKEAGASVLEQHHGPSPWKQNGERVVAGQRLMQAASDIFLGWARGPRGRDFYVRQLRDMKLSAQLERYDATMFMLYVEFCAEALARAHAKAGQAPTIAGYLGKGGAFDEAAAKYAVGYCDLVERDYELFRTAARNGVIATETSGSLTETMIH